MPTLTLTSQQVIELVKQLSQEHQTEVLRFLLLQQWSQWENLSQYGLVQARLVAKERGQNWDEMTEDEREVFIDAVVHED